MSDSEKAAKVMEALKAAKRAGANGVADTERNRRPRSRRPRTAVGSRRGAIQRILGDLRSRKGSAPRTARGRPVGGSDRRNRTVDGAGEVKQFISARDLRFSASNGLTADIAPCPKCAKKRHSDRTTNFANSNAASAILSVNTHFLHQEGK